MRTWLVCALLAVAPVQAQAQTPAAAPAAPPAAAIATVEPSGVQARVQPERVLVGEPFVYELVLTHSSHQRYELEVPPDLGDFELLSQERTPPAANQEPAVTTFRLRMSAFKLGTLTLPDLPFAVSTSEGPRRYVAPGRSLEVGSTLPPDAESKGEDLRDIQPPAEVAVRSLTLVWVVLGLVAAALLAVGAWRLYRRYRERALAAVAPPKPLDVRTRLALDALKTEDLPGRGLVKDFYVRLSEIVRGYLGERYGFDALECTSSELMTRLRGLQTPGLPEDGLMRFISESDMVKYARADASADTCRDALTFGYTLLDKTWPPPPPPEAVNVSHGSGPRVS